MWCLQDALLDTERQPRMLTREPLEAEDTQSTWPAWSQRGASVTPAFAWGPVVTDLECSLMLTLHASL